MIAQEVEASFEVRQNEGIEIITLKEDASKITKGDEGPIVGYFTNPSGIEHQSDGMLQQ